MQRATRTSRPVIEVTGLGKEFIIGGREKAVDSLRETLASSFTAPFRRLRNLRGEVPPEERLWALKDVSFTVEEGEIVGIIGRNGAGKSTLLKILSRITAPTKGRVTICGRIGSLLEVGTGFHPELTGRENIYLNGAILGMTSAEIRKKFDEIVAFSGVEKFLDTPVKRYSSGMQVRLAFAVAAHLEPEILLVDEVLAVGDAEFQRKCLGKMGDVARSGRTILFVSHSMGAVRNICSRAIWLDGGAVREDGSAPDVIDKYVRQGSVIGGPAVRRFADQPQKPFQVVEARMVDDLAATREAFVCDESVFLECECMVRENVPGLYGYLSVTRLDGIEVMESDSYDAPVNPFEHLGPSRARFVVAIPPRTLGPGEYAVYLNFASPKNINGFNVDSPGIVANFRLEDPNSRRGNRRRGHFSTLLDWRLVPG